MNKAIRNYENINKCLFEGVGSYGIPPVAPLDSFEASDIPLLREKMREAAKR